MPKVNEQGGGSIDCRPKYLKAGSRAAQQRNIFQPPPRGQLEPAYNAGYEGYGYPAAGYGQSRRYVVPLAVSKVMTKDGPAVVGTRITVQGTLNPRSDAHTRAEVAALAGLGCHCSPIDHRFVKALNGIGAITGPDFYTDRRGRRVYSGKHSVATGVHGLGSLGQNLTMVQQLANAIVTHTVPDSLLAKIADKIIADEKANNAAWSNVQKLKLIDPQNRDIETLERAQQNAWGETNTAKFYALLLPEMQSRLIGRVTVPDYKYIRSGANPGVFTQVANFLRDKAVGEAAQNLIRANYMKDTSGLGGLGIAPIVIGAVAAAIIAAGLIAYMVSKNSDAAQVNSRAAIVATCATGKLSKSACAAALNANADTDWGSIALYGAVGIGGLVALQVISSIRSAFPSR